MLVRFRLQSNVSSLHTSYKRRGFDRCVSIGLFPCHCRAIYSKQSVARLPHCRTRRALHVHVHRSSVYCTVHVHVDIFTVIVVFRARVFARTRTLLYVYFVTSTFFRWIFSNYVED